MPRLLAIDYGTKRTGLAVTDSLQIIATALDTVPTHLLLNFLENYTQKEEVEAFVLGVPKNLNGEQASNSPFVEQFLKKLKTQFPMKPVYLVDERFTSSLALDTMLRNGSKKKDRHNKSGNLDKISAVIILQDFLSQRK
ncbi:MAG: Holliday junction resolvase RuvX [Thermonemataceae bacterium]|nr:Holliday junction resolvase RuvX [Thermonemataceae bacterium]